MTLLYEFINEKRNFGMKKTRQFITQQTDQEFAEFTTLRGPPPVFESSLL